MTILLSQTIISFNTVVVCMMDETNKEEDRSKYAIVTGFVYFLILYFIYFNILYLCKKR